MPYAQKVYFLLRAFALAIPSPWKTVPPDIPMAGPLTSLRSYPSTVKCQSPHLWYHLSFPFSVFFFFFFCLFRAAPSPSVTPKLRVESELQLLATATAMPDQSRICNLGCGLGQHLILNPPGEARDRIHILMDTSWDPNPLNHDGNILCFCL